MDFSYFSMSNQGFTVIQKTTVNTNFSSEKNYVLLQQTTSKTTGPIPTIVIRVHYFIGNHIGLWAEVNNQLGPMVNNSVTQFSPKGSPNQKGEYSAYQMDNGSYVTKINNTKYNSFGLNFGIILKR